MKIIEVKPILCQGGNRTWTFVKVSTDEGIVGWGDATEWAHAQGHAKLIEEDLAPMVIGENPFEIEKLWQRMWMSSYVGGKDVNLAMTGIETALWDIVGKALNTPVYNLLGGKVRDRIRLYYDTADAFGAGYQGTDTWHEGDSSLAGVARQAKFIMDQGFTALKVYPVEAPKAKEMVHTLPLKTIRAIARKIETVRQVVGDEVDIAIDMGNRWDLPSSMALAKALEPYNLMYLEDPIRQDEAAALAYKRLAESTSTPVGTGENLYTVWAFRSYLEVGALDVVLPDVCHVGVLQAKKIAALAEAFHLPIAPHNPNSPLSTIISAHVCATVPNFLALEFWGTELEPTWRDKITTPSVGSLVKKGYLELPSGPGWGVEIDEDELYRHPYRNIWNERMLAQWTDRPAPTY